MGGLSYRDPNTGMLVGNARPNVNGGCTFTTGVIFADGDCFAAAFAERCRSRK